MRVTALASVACVLIPSLAHADGMEAPKLAPAPNGWTYQLTPYGWVPWVTGDAVIKGRSFGVSETPIEVLSRSTWCG